MLTLIQKEPITIYLPSLYYIKREAVFSSFLLFSFHQSSIKIREPVHNQYKARGQAAVAVLLYFTEGNESLFCGRIPECLISELSVLCVTVFEHFLY